MEKEVKPTNAAPVNDANTVETEVVAQSSFAAIIAKMLRKDNCKKINGLKVKSVTVTDKDSFIAVNLSLMTKIPGYVQVLTEDGDPTGEYRKGMSNVVYSTNFAISGAFKNDENLAFVGNSAANNPSALVPVLAGATIDIIQEFVPAGTEYVNPFTTRENPTPTVFEHDAIINHIVKITLGKVGERLLDRVLDKYADAFVI